MTHDELLAKINANLCGRDGCDGEHYKKDNLHGEWFALRAVVELHKPDNENDCLSCWISGALNNFQYPCPTIQAIEMELS